MLSTDGFFLGKTLFHFNDKSYSRTDIYRIFDEYFETKDKIEKNNITTKDLDCLNHQQIYLSPYEYSMYPLSIFAMDDNKRVNFINLFNLVCEIKKNRSDRKEDAIFSVYTNGETSFKEKMKLNFYIYDISEFIEICYNDFDLYEIEYGSDIYSKDFPLLILKKRNNTGNTITNISVDQIAQDIADYFNDNYDLVQNWSEHISSQYFLLCIINSLNSKGYLPHILDKIYDQILKSVKECLVFSVDQNMNSIIASIHDEKIDFETLIKYPNIQAKVTNQNKAIGKKEFEERKIINNYTNIPLKNNYALGLLAYITWFVSVDKKSDTNKMVINKLFSSIETGSLWDPKTSLWLSARIVIALSHMYSALEDDCKQKIIEVIKRIVFLYDYEKHSWKKTYSHLGNESNTLFLCMVSLIKYRDFVFNEHLVTAIDKILKDLLDHYIMNSNVYDTVVRFYIGISEIKLANGDIELYQKINDNAGVISAFIHLIDYCTKKSCFFEDDCSNLLMAKEQLTNVLFDFWTRFKIFAKRINEIVKENEYSLVPQIIYSCLFPFDNE